MPLTFPQLVEQPVTLTPELRLVAFECEGLLADGTHLPNRVLAILQPRDENKRWLTFADDGVRYYRVELVDGAGVLDGDGNPTGQPTILHTTTQEEEQYVVSGPGIGDPGTAGDVRLAFLHSVIQSGAWADAVGATGLPWLAAGTALLGNLIGLEITP